MRLKLGAAMALLIFLAPAYVMAQDAEATPYIMATYYQCDQNREARTDEIARDVMGPIFDAQIAEGNLTAWGWGSHRIGGAWRRVGYFIATDPIELLAARATFYSTMTGEHAEAEAELNEICPTHDDYMWSAPVASVAAAEVAAARPAMGLSSYFQCDMSREGDADELFEKYFAPAYQRQLDEGNISNWSWLVHSMGGKYRRAIVMDGADVGAIMTAWGAIVEEVDKKHPLASKAFYEACPSHTDYLWDVVASGPGE